MLIHHKKIQTVPFVVEHCPRHHTDSHLAHGKTGLCLASPHEIYVQVAMV